MPGLRHHFPHHGRQTNVFDAWLQFLHIMPRDKKNAMLDSDFDFFKSNAEHMDATDPVHAMCFDSMRTTLGGLWGRCLYCCSHPFRVHLQLLQCQEARCPVLSWFFDMQIASFVLCRIGIARVRSNPLWRWDCLSPKIALQQHQPTRAHQDPSSLFAGLRHEISCHADRPLQVKRPQGDWIQRPRMMRVCQKVRWHISNHWTFEGSQKFEKKIKTPPLLPCHSCFQCFSPFFLAPKPPGSGNYCWKLLLSISSSDRPSAQLVLVMGMSVEEKHDFGTPK